MAECCKTDQALMGGSLPAEWSSVAGRLRTYLPLFVVVGISLTVALAHEWDAKTPAARYPAVAVGESIARHFMGTFLAIFSMLKLFDIRGFAQAFRQYDLLAARVPAYGYAYPFVELLLGVSLLANQYTVLACSVMMVVMIIGLIGILGALRRGELLTCACLGTSLQLPLSTVAVVENATLGLLSAWMLWSEFT